jgi:hypothetical protein
LLISSRYCLDVVNLGNLQDLQEDDFELQLAGKQGKCSLTNILYTYRIAVMVSRFAYPCSHECHTSLSILYDVEFGLSLCESVWSPIRRDVI